MASKEFGYEVALSDFTGGTATADARVWPLNFEAEKHLGMLGRLTLTLKTGAAYIQISPTAAEARDLIAALQWALEPAEQVVAEAA